MKTIQNFKNALCGFYVLILFALGFPQCSPERFAPKEIADYIHETEPHPLFREADLLKYDLDYERSAEIFEAIWYSNQLHSWDDLVYCLNQLTYLNLCMNRDAVAEIWLMQTEKLINKNGGIETLEVGAQGDYWYNKGVSEYNLFKKPQKTISALNKALNIYQNPSLYVKQHLKSYQTLNMLSMAHYDFDRLTDSCFEHAKIARRYLDNPVFQKYKKENLLVLSYLQLADRNHINGIASCEEACRLVQGAKYVDTIFWIRALSQLGQMNKKSAELESDTLLKKTLIGRARNAIEKAMKLADLAYSPRAQEAYNNAAIFYTFFGSELEFKNVLKKIYVIVGQQGRRYTYPDRLSAYYKLVKVRGKTSKSDLLKQREVVRDYKKILYKYRSDSLCHRHIFQEAFMSLANLYSVLHEYDNAIKILKEALFYGTNMDSKISIPLKDLLHLESIKNGRSKFIYYGMIGNNLLRKYKRNNQDDSSLSLAFDFLNTTDSLFFSGIYSPDPDAVMSYYNEVSERENIFSNGLYAAYELYNTAHEEKYLDASFRFFEHKKSFLLYRDMIKKNSGAPSDKLIDSLFSLGQEVNKLKWAKNQNDLKGINIYNAKLDSLSKKIELLYVDLKKKQPAFYHAKILPRIPLIQEVRNKLVANQAVVQYGLDSKNLFVLYVGKNKKETIFKKIEIDSNFNNNIQELIHFLWGNKKGKILRKNDTVVNNAIYYLHEKLIEPFALFLEPDLELVVLPDRELNSIPFEVLKTTYTAPYLVEKIFLTYSPSWRIYQANKSVEIDNKKGNVSVVAYGDKSTPGADHVCDTLRSIYGIRLIDFFGPTCSKSTITSPNNKSWLWHLSLHGHCNPSNLYENYLVFKKDTLYGFDLFNLPNMPKLLILSSCNTAKGKMVAGEGTFTLSRAFIQAGVPHVVSALWSVEDAVAGSILSDFHRTFSSGESITKSLGYAKRKYLQNSLHGGIDWAALIYLV